MRKGKASIETPADARDAVRGSTAIVDGVRTVIALWPAKEDHARKVCEALNIQFEAHETPIVQGAVVKSNWPAERRVRTLHRSRNGLLVDVTEKIQNLNPTINKLLEALPLAIARAAEDGRPYTKTGKGGVYQRCHELPANFHGVGRNRLEALVQELLDKKRLTMSAAKGARPVQWLDVPGGPFDRGVGEFKTGAQSGKR